jgi:hypothetical protein
MVDFLIRFLIIERRKKMLFCFSLCAQLQDCFQIGLAWLQTLAQKGRSIISNKNLVSVSENNCDN